ncbi:MAG: malonate-semialdehyde dehydrogenase (acetylating) / methylmalonate-semialdehyde dehydrogenase [Clostridiales bacterium]|jgi:malonate-semialdehyde dehydrogenase (acetylating)/methylmalonate-semialdehyde dehydrogenase|nr:malonate-semialdehyde dehydrogenase (acetylating) / methylmalonate-semialdehyde dehydrogenase [Clostridiales bacterium]MDK2991382.1 malonate-semialdehyde dehydrogenase (acetylating) / methylmalonate-semialdehyde dehydrogenase [Clostridiales bacterium]
MSDIRKLKIFIGGKWIESKTAKYMDVHNPSTGEVIAQTPCCTVEEVNMAVEAAKEAFVTWSQMPVMKRAQIIFKFRDILEDHIDELTDIIAHENGKAWEEAKGEVLKIKEPIEFACSIPTLMLGESLMDTSKGYDTTLYREPVGVFAGIVPWNFPGMIPMGWMAPLCIATGNTMVIKAASMVPMTAMRCAELWQEAGLPDGVLNIITCSRNESEILLKHPDVKGISFVGSTSVGQHIYETAAAHGKRVQVLGEAKNHGLVLEDAPLERTAAGIMNSSFGCAGERCMALPVIVAQESIADKLVEILKTKASALKVGPAYDKTTEMGPVVSAEHRNSIIKWIEKGIEEGAELVLDGRNIVVPGYEGGYYLGPTIFDHVTPEMTIGQQEIFGPVLCIKRVKDFEEGIELMNSNPFANGSVIFTQNGYYAREFARRTHGGMVGVNVGIPVPVGIFPFNGHKMSFIGDLHVLGKDGVRFYTETKTVTTRWFDEDELKKTKVDTWDGSVGGGI